MEITAQEIAWAVQTGIRDGFTDIKPEVEELLGGQRQGEDLKSENARILEVVAEAQLMLEDESWTPDCFTRHDVSCKLAEAFVGKGEK